MWRIVIVCVLGLGTGGQATSAPALEPKLTPAKLAETFLTNEALADEIYRAKEVTLTGTVVRVSRANSPVGDSGQLQYTLELDQEKAGRGEKADVNVYFLFNESERVKLAKLKPGQTVVVRGKCSARSVWAAAPQKQVKEYSEIWVRDCTLVGEK